MSITDEVKQILNEMEKVDTNAKVDFDLYVNVFHDKFKNPDKLKGDDDYALAKWFDLIGGPTKYVDIVKDNEVVTTIPPLINTESIVTEDLLPQIDKIAMKAELQNKMIPGTGDHLINEEVEKVSNIGKHIGVPGLQDAIETIDSLLESNSESDTLDDSSVFDDPDDEFDY
jgi:hypothetical protein